MAKVFRRKYKCQKTGRQKRTRKYYGYITDELGIRCRVPLCSDKTASETMLNERRIKAERARHGLSDPFDDHTSGRSQNTSPTFNAILKRKATNRVEPETPLPA